MHFDDFSFVLNRLGLPFVARFDRHFAVYLFKLGLLKVCRSKVLTPSAAQNQGLNSGIAA